MNILFVGGGTGGHLAPAVGLAEALLDAGHSVFFLSTGRAVEQPYLRHLPTASLGLEDSSTQTLSRLSRLPRALWRVRKQAKAMHADAVVGLGGLASLAILGAPCPRILLEGNVPVGRAVAFLERFAMATLCQYPSTLLELKRGLLVGPIGRKSLEAMPSSQARAFFNLDEQKPTLLLLGGSQGAVAVNNAAISLLPELSKMGWQLLACSGKGKSEPLLEAAKAAGIAHCVVEHCENMGAAWSAADFAFCRGGASTLAEVALHGVPSMVSPYPGHKDRQQERNAQALKGGVVLADSVPTEDDCQKLLALLADTERRIEMQKAFASLGLKDGRAAAVSCLESLQA